MEYATDHATDTQQHITNFWEIAKQESEDLRPDQNSFRTQDLPLARIKKIMKLDDDVRSMMISAEAPILFAKAAELFIRELTLRAWIHTDRNRRRTLQRNDISMAVSYGDTDQFDFLIDIVPRDEGRGHRRSQQQHTQSTLQHMAGTSLVQQQQQQQQQQTQQSQVVLGGEADDVSVKTETAGGAGTTLVAEAADGTLTTISGAGVGQPTVQFTTSMPGAVAAGGGQQIQYVIQLPPGSAGMTAGQHFQLQLLPQQFQTVSTDAVAVAQSDGTLIATGADQSASAGGVQVVHMMNPQASGLHVTQPVTTMAASSSAMDAANKMQTVHVQAPTLLVQPSIGPQTLVSVDGGETYTTAQVFTSTAAAADEAAAASSEDQVMHDPSGTLEHHQIEKMEDPSADV